MGVEAETNLNASVVFFLYIYIYMFNNITHKIEQFTPSFDFMGA